MTHAVVYAFSSIAFFGSYHVKSTGMLGLEKRKNVLYGFKTRMVFKGLHLCYELFKW